MISRYFKWLQKGNPVGIVEKYPELNDKYETNIPGVYCVGDLTGIPLIKLAINSGVAVVSTIQSNLSTLKSPKGEFDIVIIGAGPAGIAAGIEAQKQGLSFVILEAGETFTTIQNFPAGKPIYGNPDEIDFDSPLTFEDGTKESILEEFQKTAAQFNLPIKSNFSAKHIEGSSGKFTITSDSGSVNGKQVIIALGKSGNARSLGVPGESLEKVYTRLIDPAEHTGKNILVVGGGDSALEAAIALAENGNQVTLSYRKAELARPKPENLEFFNILVESGKIVPIFSSAIKEVQESEVLIDSPQGSQTIQNDIVFALIGRELPISFFEKSKISVAGTVSKSDILNLMLFVLLSCVLYFGKKASFTGITSIGDFLTIPLSLSGLNWAAATNTLIAWVTSWGVVILGTWKLGSVIRNFSTHTATPWASFKTIYFTGVFALISFSYVSSNLTGGGFLGKDMGYWYSFLYSITVFIFGIRRIQTKPTPYIKIQTSVLIFVQVVLLFLVPQYLLPWMGKEGMFSTWILTHVFPGESYWRWYGFILAWPLFIYNVITDQPTLFWLITSVVQSFVIIPYIVIRWGKGAYCGWICSCGALAETLGNEYRTKAPHGATAKKYELAGQWVLFAITITTAVYLITQALGSDMAIAQTILKVYIEFVDIFLAGVVGVGAYFFLSGRIWCRFFCPLAALMHFYGKFSIYRILANKKTCISCNICTKVCHMGIDVMGYANKGIPMNDVECVRCSTCIVSCPMDTLSFGTTKSIDMENTSYKENDITNYTGWKSGL